MISSTVDWPVSILLAQPNKYFTPQHGHNFDKITLFEKKILISCLWKSFFITTLKFCKVKHKSLYQGGMNFCLVTLSIKPIKSCYWMITLKLTMKSISKPCQIKPSSLFRNRNPKDHNSEAGRYLPCWANMDHNSVDLNKESFLNVWMWNLKD